MSQGGQKRFTEIVGCSVPGKLSDPAFLGCNAKGQHLYVSVRKGQPSGQFNMKVQVVNKCSRPPSSFDPSACGPLVWGEGAGEGGGGGSMGSFYDLPWTGTP